MFVISLQTKKSENDLLDSKNKPVFKPVCPHCKVACNTSDVSKYLNKANVHIFWKNIT